MQKSLATYITEQAFFRVLRALFLSNNPRHLRDIARTNKLSPGGTRDALRRLENLGAVTKFTENGRTYYTLTVDSATRNALGALFDVAERDLHYSRAIRLSQSAESRWTWMEEAFELYQTMRQQ